MATLLVKHTASRANLGIEEVNSIISSYINWIVGKLLHSEPGTTLDFLGIFDMSLGGVRYGWNYRQTFDQLVEEFCVEIGWDVDEVKSVLVLFVQTVLEELSTEGSSVMYRLGRIDVEEGKLKYNTSQIFRSRGRSVFSRINPVFNRKFKELSSIND